MCIRDRCYFMSFGMPTVLSAAILLVFMGFICTFVPVSLYTIGPDIIPSAAYAAIILAIVTFGQNLGMTPVSYTHLDVYKRQSLFKGFGEMTLAVSAAKMSTNSTAQKSLCLEMRPISFTMPLSTSHPHGIVGC